MELCADRRHEPGDVPENRPAREGPGLPGDGGAEHEPVLVRHRPPRDIPGSRIHYRDTWREFEAGLGEHVPENSLGLSARARTTRDLRSAGQSSALPKGSLWLVPEQSLSSTGAVHGSTNGHPSATYGAPIARPKAAYSPPIGRLGKRRTRPLGAKATAVAAGNGGFKAIGLFFGNLFPPHPPENPVSCQQSTSARRLRHDPLHASARWPPAMTTRGRARQPEFQPH